MQPAEIIGNPGMGMTMATGGNSTVSNAGGFASVIFEPEDKYSRNKIYGVKTKPPRASLPGPCEILDKMCVNVIFANNTFNYRG